MTATSGFATGLAAADVARHGARGQVDGRSVCVGHTEDDEWGAIDNVCTHDGGVLGDGELEVRPSRMPPARRSLRPVQRTRAGAAAGAAGDAYPVRVEDGEIVVDLP